MSTGNSRRGKIAGILIPAQEQSLQEFRVGDWLVQPELNVISRQGNTVHLEPKVMNLLAYLAENAGEVLHKEGIIRAVWPDTFVSDEALTYSISELRKAFNDDPKSPTVIQTIPRRGYRLIAPVSLSGPKNDANLESLKEKTLADQLVSGPLPIELALRYAIDISDELSELHCNASVHGQLKPSNITVSKSGAKLKDFARSKERDARSGADGEGLAQWDLMLSTLVQRAIEGRTDGPSAPLAQNESSVSQEPNAEALHYLAPEQVQGKAPETRTDIFAFGAILYEMATGRKAFSANSGSTLKAAILEHAPPPISALQPLARLRSIT